MLFDITDDADAGRLSVKWFIDRSADVQPDIQPGPLPGVPLKLNLQRNLSWISAEEEPKLTLPNKTVQYSMASV